MANFATPDDVRAQWKQAEDREDHQITPHLDAAHQEILSILGTKYPVSVIETCRNALLAFEVRLAYGFMVRRLKASGRVASADDFGTQLISTTRDDLMEYVTGERTLLTDAGALAGGAAQVTRFTSSTAGITPHFKGRTPLDYQADPDHPWESRE